MHQGAPQFFQQPIKLELPEGIIEATVELPNGPMRLVELAYTMLGISGAVAEVGAEAVKKLGFEMSCGKGCGDCCRQMVPFSPLEASMIAELVESMPAEMGQRIQHRFISAEKALEASELLPVLFSYQNGELDQKGEKELSKAYFRLNIPCPFLEDESCAIYSYRPSMCREYMVVSPKENCRDPFEFAINKIPISIRLSEALTWLWAEALNENLILVPSTLSLKFDRENPNTRTIAGDSRAITGALLQYISKTAQRNIATDQGL